MAGHYFLPISVLCLMMITCTALKQTTMAADQAALLALKAHITSDPFQILSRNWSSIAPSSSVCGWIGVRCGSRHQTVAALNISGMALSGTIPPHLGNLSFLVSLDMSKNFFHGNLSQEFSGLRRLRFMDLGSNNFTGEVSTWFGHFPQLQTLFLYDNDFSGLIPSSISNLSKLETLSFGGNLLTGEIPEVIGNLHSLRYLNLQNNGHVGSIPKSIFNMSTLEYLALTSNDLTGTLPADICHNLPSLKGLYLSANELNGQIPSNLYNCSRLQILSLSANRFSGFIPKELGNLEILVGLSLADNKLQGAIPPELGNLHNLRTLAMAENRISGFIPKEIGNLSMLTYFYMFNNFLTGEIPEEMSNLHKLDTLVLDFNNLNGSIPMGIFNLSTLRKVSFAFNYLIGNLPSNIGYHQLPNLQIVYLNRNSLTGAIPDSIANCSKLTHLSLVSNQLICSIPKSLGNLELLETLRLVDNHLTSDSSSLELDFLTSLTKCKSLRILLIGNNPLNGSLPNSIGNLSISLQYFEARRAKIRGPIPSEIGNLSSLILISLDYNHLTGDIPRALLDLKNLQGLSLIQNKLGGTLSKFCNMNSLSALYLSQNQVFGSIPDCFGNMTSLRSLYLDSNLFTCSISKSFWKLKDLIVLDLATNSFNGSLPVEMGNLKAAISMNLSMNQISGDIPSTLGNLQNLQNLSLANNQLQGSIPESIGKMLSLTSLNLSHNHLSGLIPKSLESLLSLNVFDVSYNHLKGEIPIRGPFKNFTSESFTSNDALCGDPKFKLPQCQSNQKHTLTLKRVLLLTLIPLVMANFAVLAFTFVFLRCRKKSEVPNATDVLAVPTTRALSYYELQRATNGYSESNLLGTGSFGSVYKGILNDGKSVAVKVFNLQLEGSFRSFDVECEVLCKLRHRNLVKVISCCSNENFKALVLEYMSNGSLDKWLHSDHHFLNMLQRLDMMINVAYALQYLHQEYSTPVIHCDLKPSNILIDEDMVAHVSDFGIAKFLGKDESIGFTNTLATIGYIAPEYGSEGLVSTACDVYSYGILLVEVFTGKGPNDEDDLDLKRWVQNAMPDSILQVIDAELLKPNQEHPNEGLDCLPLIMELALNCVSESPKERLSISEVVVALHKIKLGYPSSRL